MKYLLMGPHLYVENEINGMSVRYSSSEEKWVDGGYDLWDSRVGFDESEPIGSPYRYGNGSCMDDITEITKEEAEKFIDQKIDESLLIDLLTYKEISPNS